MKTNKPLPVSLSGSTLHFFNQPYSKIITLTSECLKIHMVVLIPGDSVFGVMHSGRFCDETQTRTNDISGRLRPAERLL